VRLLSAQGTGQLNQHSFQQYGANSTLDIDGGFVGSFRASITGSIKLSGILASGWQ
jgi:hypothetical protein